ncbi:MAG: class I SAM-dependent DNA methyltransferase [Acidimicrobiales bacterium]
MPDTPLPGQADLGRVTFSPGAEDWIEFGPAHARERIGFHDYAALYAVPGLYERVFHDELGMCTAARVVGLYAEALRQLRRQTADERVVDLGAGNGLGGEELRRIGIGRVVGVDIEPAAREAALRDRPGAYDHYIVGDLASLPAGELASVAAMEPTAVLALSALGPGHAPPTVLDTALGLLATGGVFAFAVTPALLPGREDAADQSTGYPELLSELFDHRADLLARHEYVHRRQTDGSDHLAVAFVGRMR